MDKRKFGSKIERFSARNRSIHDPLTKSIANKKQLDKVLTLWYKVTSSMSPTGTNPGRLSKDDGQQNQSPSSAVIRKVIRFNSVVVVLLAATLFVYPSLRAVLNICDPGLRQAGTPQSAWRLYHSLSPRYAKWAKKRVSRGRAAGLSTSNISGTEWPLFGSVFYLWGIENLQAAWDAGDYRGGNEPKVFAKDAIVAASELVIDPKHASWVKKHWGEDYLHRHNVFYRMLVIAALTSRERLLHDGAHMELLRDQVESFSKELEASKTGLLDDYPSECYPGDVMAALMCIKRADAVLGTDHSRFLNSAVRAFTGGRSTRHQFPPYQADSRTGSPLSDARGCANSYMCLTAPELWPPQAKQWFELYDRFFWQQRITAVGFREYPKDVPHSDWTMDVDAGPVISGHGVSASAFGVGAARKNGRFDRAYPLAAEMLATVVELPNGVLVVPRLLSNLSDAPLLGEAAILWQLSVQPEKGFPVKTGGSVPTYVYIVLPIAFLFGVWRILKAICTFRDARRLHEYTIPAPTGQMTLWAALMAGAAFALVAGPAVIGFLVLIVAVMLPAMKRKRTSTNYEDWPEAKATTTHVGD